jgi:hypothetical protein
MAYTVKTNYVPTGGPSAPGAIAPLVDVWTNLGADSTRTDWFVNASNQLALVSPASGWALAHALITGAELALGEMLEVDFTFGSSGVFLDLTLGNTPILDQRFGVTTKVSVGTGLSFVGVSGGGGLSPNGPASPYANQTTTGSGSAIVAGARYLVQFSRERLSASDTTNVRNLRCQIFANTGGVKGILLQTITCPNFSYVGWYNSVSFPWDANAVTAVKKRGVHASNSAGNNDFAINRMTWYEWDGVAAPTITPSVGTIPISSSATIGITGTGTAWTVGTNPFTLTSLPSGTTLSSVVINSPTSATINLSVGATAGTFTITETASGATALVAVSATAYVTNPSFTIVAGHRPASQSAGPHLQTSPSALPALASKTEVNCVGYAYFAPDVASLATTKTVQLAFVNLADKPITFKMSVQRAIAGAKTQLTFSGATSITVAPGGCFQADPIPLTATISVSGTPDLQNFWRVSTYMSWAGAGLGVIPGGDSSNYHRIIRTDSKTDKGWALTLTGDQTMAAEGVLETDFAAPSDAVSVFAPSMAFVQDYTGRFITQWRDLECHLIPMVPMPTPISLSVATGWEDSSLAM